MSAHDSVSRWIDDLKAGETVAAQKLWDRYFGRMVELAQQRLAGNPKRVADEEDVALSAFNSFCLGARNGRFPQLTDRHNLWPLLVAITAHKSVDLIRRESRQKRGGGRLRRWIDRLLEPEELISRAPTPEFAVQVAEELDRLLERLHRTGDAQLREIALWKMQGDSNGEIAERLGCVRRTVERKLKMIARIWERDAFL